MLTWAARSEQGPVRPHNQDRVRATPGLWAVADGMGRGAVVGEATGAALGALAGATITDERSMRAAFQAMERAFCAALPASPEAACEVLVAVLLDGGGRLALGGLGRCCAWRQAHGGLQLLGPPSRRALIERAMSRPAQPLSPEGARRFVSYSVDVELIRAESGRTRLEELAYLTVPVCRGDRILLSTDGLHDVLAEAELERHLLRHGSAQEAVDAVIAAAVAAGSQDNLSAVAIDLG